MTGFKHFDTRAYLEAAKAKSRMYLYAIEPIDLWEPWLRTSEFLIRLPHRERQIAQANLEMVFEAAKQLLPIEWDGDFREGPFVAGLPGHRDIELAYMIAWKQDNNRTTFVASPEELPWLEGNNYSRAVVPAVPTLCSKVKELPGPAASQ